MLKSVTTRRLKKTIALGSLVSLFSLLAACGRNSVSLEEKLTFATGVWMQFEKSLGEGATPIGPFINDGEIFAAAVIAKEYPEDFMCMDVSNFLSGFLKIYRYSDDKFKESQSIDLIDVYLQEAGFGDIKNDSTQEIILTSYCYKGSSLEAFELVNGKWSTVPNLTASVFRNGVLMDIQPDCTPSCASGGTEYTKLTWNGSAFVDAELVTSDGKPVDLSVTTTCPSFHKAKTLPLKPCDEGKLVEQLLALVRNFGATYEDVDLSLLTNRYTPQLAQWLKIYQYRHGKPISTTVSEDVFSDLGESWNPIEFSPEFNIFHPFCKHSEAPYECDLFGYLWPTESCPEYRYPSTAFPVKRCETGVWVLRIANALRDFDGKEFKNELGAELFDEELETRVKNFQRARELEVDGLVGANTWRALIGPESSDWLDTNNDGLHGPGDRQGD